MQQWVSHAFHCHLIVGPMSHRTPLCAGHYRGLAAGPGWEVYYVLPSQLRQARLLQDQAGELEREDQGQELPWPPLISWFLIFASNYFICILESENHTLNHVCVSLHAHPVSIAVRDVPCWPARTLLVCVRLERKENRRIRRCPWRCPLPPGDHSLSPAALLTHTYTQAAFH